MIGYLLLLCAASPALPPVEAELLTQMDAKIAAAKTLRIEFEIWGEGDKPEMKGSLAIAERNRLRYELQFRGEAQPPGVLVGDGKRLSFAFPDKAEILPMPDWYTEAVKSWLGRGGTYLSMWKVSRYLSRTPAGKAPGPDNGPRLSNVRLLPDEEIKGVKCRVVGYDLAGEKDDLPDAHGRVWIDPKTRLPVQRELNFGFGFPGTGRKVRPTTAVHTKFEIDPKLDDRLFELPGEADLLLAQMDARIRAAKSLRIEFVITKGTEKRDRVMKGSLMLASRNRFRIESNADGESAVTVSDGKRMVTTGTGKKDEDAVPDWHNEVLKSWLGRGGTCLSVMAVGRWEERTTGKRPGAADGPVVTKAKLLPDEEVDGVKARVVEYDLIWTGPPSDLGEARVRVWLDSKTLLPLRRKMTIRDGLLEGNWTAVHTKFELDPKLNDKLFELPK